MEWYFKQKQQLASEPASYTESAMLFKPTPGLKNSPQRARHSCLTGCPASRADTQIPFPHALDNATETICYGKTLETASIRRLWLGRINV